MGTATIIRVVKRPIRKLLRPLRMRLIGWQIRHSEKELLRLRAMRADLIHLEEREHIEQVRLTIRRCQLERS